MINYSVYMMGNPIKKDEPEKAYAKNQVNEIWSLDKFAKHIASHNSLYSHGLVGYMISDMCDCLMEQLLNGNKVQLGALGTFGISLSCEGAESIDRFTSRNIKSVNISFVPGEDFENLIGRAEFNLVASRAIQAATLKAVKGGEDTVDLAALRKAPSTGPTPEEPDGPDTPGGGNEGGNTGDGEDDFT